MDYRDLQALRAVVVSGTTKAAALELGLSQPTVSRSISQIEAVVGKSVFVRHRGRLIPTPAALQISESASKIHDILASLKCDLDQTNKSSQLKVGVTSDSSGEALQKTLKRFRSLYPHTDIQIEMSDRSRFGVAIADGRMDLGICASSLSQEGVTAEVLYSCDLCCLLPAGHRLAAHTSISPEELRDETLITVADSSTAYGHLHQTLLELGMAERNRMKVSSARLAYDMVVPGLGVAIVTPLPFLAGPLSQSIVLRPIAQRLPWKLYGLTAVNSPRHLLVRQFCRAFQRCVAALTAPSLDFRSDESSVMISDDGDLMSDVDLDQEELHTGETELR